MRILLLFIVLALAGCVAEETDEGPKLIGVCPQWIAGDARFEATRSGAEMTISFPGNETVNGHPLDMVVMTFTTDSPVTVRAFGQDGNRLLLRDADQDGAPSLTIDGEREVKVHLSPVEQGADAAPGPIRLTFDGAGSLSLVAEPFYRVCGVPGP